MKRLALLAFAALTTLVFAGRANAQESFVPLVQKETAAIVRLDLTKIDSELLSSQLGKIAGAAVDYFVDDAKQAEETKKALPFVTAIASQYFTAVVEPFKDAGVKEIFFVVDQSSDPENPLYPYLAIPTAGMTEDQIDDAYEALSAAMQNANSVLKYRFKRHGFLFSLVAPQELSKDDAKTYVKKRFTKLNSVDAGEFVAGFDFIGKDSTLTGVGLPVVDEAAARAQINKSLETADLGDIEEDVKTFAEKATALQVEISKLTRFNAWKADLANLEMFSAIQMNSDADAAKYLELIGAFKADISAIIDAIFEKALADAATDADPTAINALKTAVNALTADVVDDIQANGSIVSFTFNEQFFSKHDAEIKAVVEAAKNIAPKTDATEEEVDSENEDELDLDAETETEDAETDSAEEDAPEEAL